MSNKNTDFTFEKGLAQLEQLVTRLETGELPLQSAWEAFEEGVGLVKKCRASLDVVEQAIQKVSEQNGVILTESITPSQIERN